MDPTVFGLALDRLGVFSNGRRNRSFEAARLVMVEGVTMAQAVRICGVRRQAIYKAMMRVESAFSDIGICPYCGARMPSV